MISPAVDSASCMDQQPTSMPSIAQRTSLFGCETKCCLAGLEKERHGYAKKESSSASFLAGSVLYLITVTPSARRTGRKTGGFGRSELVSKTEDSQWLSVTLMQKMTEKQQKRTH